MRETAPGVYTIVSRGRLLTVSQEGPKVAFDCPETDLSYWKEYFDCATDYGHIQSMVSPKDPYLTAAAKAGQGIRILRQEPWEMIITFVISQQKTIPKIREAVEALSRAYGTRLETAPETKPLAAVSPRTAAQGLEGEGFYAFPTPEQLNRASLEELSALKLGYRAKYIKKLCADAAEGRLDLIFWKPWTTPPPWTISPAFTESAGRWPTASACLASTTSRPFPWTPGSRKS